MPTSPTPSFSKRARSYSRPQTPTSSSIHSRYGSSPARSSKPKVLPFPDLPFRGSGSGVSRDASRATSPAPTPPLISPRGSQSLSPGASGSAIGLSSLGLEAGGSGGGASGYFGSSEEIGIPPSGYTSASGTGYNTPSGATTPRSPLARPSLRQPVGHPPSSFTAYSADNASSSTSIGTGTRSRSQTTANIMQHPRTNHSVSPPPVSANSFPPSSSTSPAPQSILLNPIISSANPPTRIEGFHPIPVSPTATIRPASVPTSTTAAFNTPLPSASSSSALAPPLPSLTISKDASSVTSKKLPPNPPTTSSSSQAAALTPALMPDAFKDHLYSSFLKGTCADVRIYVRKWGMGWAVHRMVLVQASFFHSMFLGGFAETGASRSKGKGKGRAIFDDDEWTGENVEIQFDDPNITQAAFEICLSRLYSPFPALQFPVAMIPVPSQPLSPCFDGRPPISFPEITNVLPSRTQLATPRFLLSLLATTIYLGHSSLLRQTLGLLLRTVTPVTIGRYLSFAVGDGIGEEEYDGQTDECARGLEDVAIPLVADTDGGSTRSKGRARTSTDSTASASSARTDEEEQKSEGHTGLASGTTRRTSRPSPLSFDQETELEDDTDSIMPHFYGFSSDKLGEACCCLFSRWGVDILHQEIKFDESSPPWRVFASGGIHAKFIRALLSSDSFFVDSEMGRYRAARKVLDLRRRGREDHGDLGASPQSVMMGAEEDEEEWEDEEEMEKVFTDGIYYTHMTFEDLSIIASDIDPYTGLPFAPLHVLQAAHWSAADLKSRIVSATAGPGEPDPALGLDKTAAELVHQSQRRRRPRGSRNVTPSTEYGSFSISMAASSSVSSVSSIPPAAPSSIYHPIPTDDTNRIGAAGLQFTNTATTASMPMPLIQGMPDFSPGANLGMPEDLVDKTKQLRLQPHDERTYFGLSRECRLLSDLSSSPPSSRWTKAEPFRFSVEFWNVHLLAERERAYSTTHFYAGSWFNVYVQTIRKKDKGTQLGVYLHRQSPGEPFPPPSSPETGGGEEVVGSPGMMGVGVPLGRSVTGHVTVGSPRAEGGGGDLDLSQEVGGKEPYRDQRPITKAYFSITCASALGTCSIQFSSAPDSFTLSQSWGWKSSALRTEEYLSAGAAGTGQGQGEPPHELEVDLNERDGLDKLVDRVDVPKGGSLRASVVVGVV